MQKTKFGGLHCSGKLAEKNKNNNLQNEYAFPSFCVQEFHSVILQHTKSVKKTEMGQNPGGFKVVNNIPTVKFKQLKEFQCLQKERFHL